MNNMIADCSDVATSRKYRLINFLTGYYPLHPETQKVYDNNTLDEYTHIGIYRNQVLATKWDYAPCYESVIVTIEYLRDYLTGPTDNGAGFITRIEDKAIMKSVAKRIYEELGEIDGQCKKFIEDAYTIPSRFKYVGIYGGEMVVCTENCTVEDECKIVDLNTLMEEVRNFEKTIELDVHGTTYTITEKDVLVNRDTRIKKETLEMLLSEIKDLSK